MTIWSDMPLPARKRLCRDLIAQGMRPKDIALEYGATRNAIIGFCNRHDIALRPAKPTAPAGGDNGISPAQLITDNMGKLEAYSKKLGKNNHEEVFQEACATIMGARTFDPSHAPGPWLWRHVRSAAARILRGQTTYVAVGLTNDWDAPVSEPTQEAETELSLFLRRAAGLPEQQRQVCELVANDNSLAEAGEIMGVSKQAAGVHLQKARGALRLAA